MSQNLSFSFLSNKYNSSLKILHASTLSIISKNSLESFFIGSPLTYSGTIKEYFAPVLLVENEIDVAYPIFFISIIKEKKDDLISSFISTKKVLLNSLAIDKLKEINIDLTDISRLDDLSSFVFSLSSMINLKDEKEHYSLIFAYSFFNEEDIIINSLYPILKNNALFSLPTKYQNLYSPNKTHIQKNDNFIINILSLLEEEKIVSLKYSNEKDIINILINLAFENLKNNKNIAVFISDDKSKKLTSFTENNFLFSSFPKSKQEKTIEFDHRYDEAKDTLLSYIKKKENIYYLLKVIYSSLNKDEIKEISESKNKIFTLNTSNYSEEDYEVDLVFLNKLSSFPTLFNTKLKDHVYYGLSCSDKKENYNIIHSLISQIISDIQQFKEILSEKNILDLYNNPISSFSSFEKYGEELYLLETIPNITKEYDTKDIDINSLKKLYQSISSIILLINNILDSNIYNDNINDIVEKYNSATFLQKRKIKKHIENLYIDKSKKDKNKFSTIMRLLNLYVEQNQEIISLLPASFYQNERGIESLKDIQNIENQINNYNRFKQYKEKNPEFSLNNPLISACLDKPKVLAKRISDYRIINKLYLSLKTKINTFIGYFLDDNYPFFTSNINELLTYFQNKTRGDYQLFSNYADFKTELKKTSFTLQLALRRFQNFNIKYQDYKVTYLKSLILSIKDNADENFEEIEKEFNQAEENYKNMILNIKDIVINNLCYYTCTNENSALYLFTPDDLYLLNEDIFDLAIIFNTEDFSQVEIFKILSSAKTLLLLNKNSSYDERIIDFNSLSCDLKDQFIFYKLTHDELNNHYQKYLEDNSYQEIDNDYPYLIKDDDNIICLFFNTDIYDKEEEFIQLSTNLNILYSYQIKVIDIIELLK